MPCHALSKVPGRCYAATVIGMVPVSALGSGATCQLEGRLALRPGTSCSLKLALRTFMPCGAHAVRLAAMHKPHCAQNHNVTHWGEREHAYKQCPAREHELG